MTHLRSSCERKTEKRPRRRWNEGKGKKGEPGREESRDEEENVKLKERERKSKRSNERERGRERRGERIPVWNRSAHQKRRVVSLRSEGEKEKWERGQVDSFTRPPRFQRDAPLYNIPDVGAPSGPVLPPPAGAEPAAGPTPRDRRRPPVLAYHSSPRRGPPTDNESRNSPGLPARRFLSVSPLQSVDQTKESEKRPTTSEFQGPLAPYPLPLSLHSLSALSAPHRQSPLLKTHLPSTQCLRLPTRSSFAFSLSLFRSYWREYRCCPFDSRIVQRNPRHPPR